MIPCSMVRSQIPRRMPAARRIIARDHAKRRRPIELGPALTELDYLLAVDDFSRVGPAPARQMGRHRTVEKAGATPAVDRAGAHLLPAVP